MFLNIIGETKKIRRSFVTRRFKNYIHHFFELEYKSFFVFYSGYLKKFITQIFLKKAKSRGSEAPLHLEVCHKNRLKILLDGEVSQIVYYYDPQGFKILDKISSGASVLVYNVCWKDTSKFAIKKFIGNSKEKAIINEIHLTGLVNLHPNIIQFYGVTKLNDEINYSLVLEYAEGGTLGKYLKDNTITFKWESQLKFAKEISSAISWLHVDKEIVHGDLHPNNILIQKDTVKLADFGRSYLKGSVSDTESDILNGKREKPISGTNYNFVTLYKKCWQHEPDERPDIRQVISEINNIENISNNFKIEKIEKTEIVTTEKLENEVVDLPSCDDCDINSDKYNS
ncbi:unnamed protein product [Rhizophagus irregularis]|nr:unnamed protein product [Rhizophagus irregularis]